MSEKKTYEGSCHCKRVRYNVTTDLAQIIACNCSICAKSGTLLTFVPPDQFELLSGEDALTDYQFSEKVIHHTFCSTCGIKSYATGTRPGKPEMVAINVRCLEGVDPSTLPLIHYDGKNR